MFKIYNFLENKISHFDERSFLISVKYVSARVLGNTQGNIHNKQTHSNSAQDGLKAASTCGRIERERD